MQPNRLIYAGGVFFSLTRKPVGPLDYTRAIHAQSSPSDSVTTESEADNLTSIIIVI